MFIYLVVNRHRHVPATSWPRLCGATRPGAVDARLNPLLSKLRRVFGADSVDGRSTIRLCLPRAWVDLEAAAEAIHRAESSVAQQDWARAWGPALTAMFVAERDFLPGEDAPWIDEIRHQLTELRLRALECYAAAGLGLGGTELAAAVRAGRQLTRLAPLRESGYRYLMQALAAQGNLAEALDIYGQSASACVTSSASHPAPHPASCTNACSRPREPGAVTASPCSLRCVAAGSRAPRFRQRRRQRYGNGAVVELSRRHPAREVQMKTATEKAISRPGPGLGDGVLVDPGWLAGHLHDPVSAWSKSTSAGPPTTTGTSTVPCCGTSTPT